MNPNAPREQRELELSLPRDLAMEQEAESWRCTGARIFSKSEVVEGILSDLLLGHGERRTAKRWGVSRESLRVVKKAAEAQGVLRPLKERLVAKIGQLAELSTERILEAIEDGEIHPNFMNQVFGTSVDKLQILTGGPTEIVSHKKEASRDEIEAGVRAFLGGLAEVEAKPVDSESSVKCVELQDVAKITQGSGAGLGAGGNPVVDRSGPHTSSQEEGGGGGWLPVPGL